MSIPYKPRLIPLARELRKQATLAEVLLWQHLRNRQFHGLDFHRQKPVDEYIVDFYCPTLSLVIEIDGSSHDPKLEQDRQRQARLEELGLTVIRFLDREVKTNLAGVLQALKQRFGLGG